MEELRKRREEVWQEHRLQLFNLIHRALNVFESQLIFGDKHLQLKAALGLPVPYSAATLPC